VRGLILNLSNICLKHKFARFAATKKAAAASAAVKGQRQGAGLSSAPRASISEDL